MLCRSGNVERRHQRILEKRWQWRDGKSGPSTYIIMTLCTFPNRNLVYSFGISCALKTFSCYVLCYNLYQRRKSKCGNKTVYFFLVFATKLPPTTGISFWIKDRDRDTQACIRNAIVVIISNNLTSSSFATYIHIYENCYSSRVFVSALWHKCW